MSWTRYFDSSFKHLEIDKYVKKGIEKVDDSDDYNMINLRRHENKKKNGYSW